MCPTHGAARSSGRWTRAIPAAARSGSASNSTRAATRNKPSLGTIVAIEGGPGYATTSSRSDYLDLFHPLLDRRDVLLVDNRGTGTSSVRSTARRLQSLQGNYIDRIGLCGEQLGRPPISTAPRSPPTTSRRARRARHRPDRSLRRLVRHVLRPGLRRASPRSGPHADARRRLPGRGSGPLVPRREPAIVDAFRLVCSARPHARRSAAIRCTACSRRRRAARCTRSHGTGLDGDGVLRDVDRRPACLRTSPASPPTARPIYRSSTVPACVARRRRSGAAAAHGRRDETDPDRRRPAGVLLRPVRRGDLQRLSATLGHRGAARRRPAQYDASVADLRATDPTRSSRSRSPTGRTRRGPSSGRASSGRCPSNWVPPVRNPATYPDVPTLVLVGRPRLAHVARGRRASSPRFPNSTFVQVANSGHVMRIADFGAARATSSSTSSATRRPATRAARRSTTRCARSTSSRCGSATSPRRPAGSGRNAA